MNRKVNEIKIKENLTCLVRGLVSRKTTIELRNENSITGTIENVDHLMNIDVSNVVFKNIYGQENKFDKFYIRGRNVRYVHIPLDVDIIDTVQKEVQKADKILNFVPEKITRPKSVINKEQRDKRNKKAAEKAAETRRKLGL